MAHRVVLHVLSVLGVLQKGLTALVQTQPTVTAAVGEEAHLRCQLMEARDVVQVTWQKLSHQREETLANYTNKNGLKVNPAFRDKVQFTDAGLKNSSIVIMKVTEEDEGCYHCLFNTHPEGALTGSTCLKVYELHEPVLHVRESNFTETVVSCSATGRPAPTVTLRVLRGNGHFSNYSSVSVNNTNSTVTVTTTAVMTGFHDNSTEVGCSAQVLSAPLKEVNKTIPADRSNDSLTALVQTQPTVTAAVGEEAHLRCQLMETRDVVQVTWQKVSHQREETLANYTSKYGLKVSPAFRDKVQFTDAGLQNSSIVIMKVTEEDEGCYHCLFNTHPEGALTGSTCLKVYELHEPVLHVRKSNSAETVVSCSATGRPAPTVTLRVLRGNGRFSDYSSVSVNNTNSTVTVTTTAVMTRSRDDSTEVGCSAQVLSAPLKEVNKTIPADRRSDRQSSNDNNPQINIASASAAAGCLAAVATALVVQRQRKSRKHKDSEEKETPPKPIEHTDETTTPAIPEESEHVRPETSTLKKQQRRQSKSSISDRKKLAKAVVITVNYWHRTTVVNSNKTGD